MQAEPQSHPTNGVTPPSVDTQIDGLIVPAIGVVMNGILASFVQHFPFDRLVKRVCFQIGMACAAGMSGGTLPATLKLRAECKDAFDKGMASVPVMKTTQMPQQGVQPPQG